MCSAVCLLFKDLWEMVPVDGLLAVLCEVLVGLGEVLVTKETTVCREGGRVG